MTKKGTGVKEYLAVGISAVSINYRFVQEAAAAGVQPLVKCPLEDAALQFVRSKSTDWNIDKSRAGASGGSAAACSSLWLAFHDDMGSLKATILSPANPRDCTKLRYSSRDGLPNKRGYKFRRS